MSSGRIAQHRNYGELMERHERDVKLRRIVKTFIYFLIIAALLIIFVTVRRWEQKKVNGKPETGFVRSGNLTKVTQPEMPRNIEPTG
jgi:hypothetical protein